jgi:ankyrin repeat protein
MLVISEVENSYLSSPKLDIQIALNNAIRDGNFQQMVECMNNGADANGIDDISITPLMWAAHYGRVDMMLWLCDQGAKVDKVSWGGYTALTDAVVKDHLDAVVMLLNRGADRFVRTHCELPLTALTKNPDILRVLNSSTE